MGGVDTVMCSAVTGVLGVGAGALISAAVPRPIAASTAHKPATPPRSSAGAEAAGRSARAAVGGLEGR